MTESILWGLDCLRAWEKTMKRYFTAAGAEVRLNISEFIIFYFIFINQNGMSTQNFVVYKGKSPLGLLNTLKYFWN